MFNHVRCIRGGFGLLVVAVASLIAGCPTNGAGTRAKAYTGSWAGTLDRSVTQSVDGHALPPATSTKSAAITFGEDGRPARIAVIGYSQVPTIETPDLTATVKDQGDTQTLTQTVDGMLQTYVVTVRSASYSETSAQLTMDIEYSSSLGPVVSSHGTGVQTIEAVASGTSLTYSAKVNYTVTSQNTSANLTLQMDEVIACSGSMSPAVDNAGSASSASDAAANAETSAAEAVQRARHPGTAVWSTGADRSARPCRTVHDTGPTSTGTSPC